MTTRLGPGVGVCRAWRILTAAAWTPLSLGAALQGWFDAGDASTLWADTGGTVPAGDLALVARWDDKSGLGRHVTQATSGNRPLRDASFSPSVLVTDGTDRLHSAAFTAIPQPYTICVISDNLVVGGSYFDNGSGGTRSAVARVTNNVTLNMFGGSSLSVTTPTLDARRAFLFEFNGASSRVWVLDGSAFVQAGSTGNAGTNQLADFKLFGNGSAFLESSETCEIFAFSGSLSSQIRSDVAGYIKPKWGL